MAGKRGVSSELFIWIFSVIAGALLLLFFIIWAGRHAETSTTVEDITFLRTFEQQISSLSTTDELSKTLTFPRPVNMHISCDTWFTDQAREQSSLFLYSPESLTEQKYTLVGKSWHFPFFIDMFYYLVPEGNLVVLFYEPQAASFVTSLDLPSTLPIKSLPLSAYSLSALQQQLKGYRTVTLVFFGKAPDPTSLLATLKSLPVTLVEVDLARSSLTFYPGGKSSSYLGDTMLLGSFFGHEQYSCHYRRAVERIHSLASLYQQKTALLQQKLGAGSTCQQTLIQGGSTLTALATTDDPEQLLAFAASLTTINEELARYACPQIY